MQDQWEKIFTPLGYDGKWSLLSKLLLKTTNSNSTVLYLDKNWSLSPQNFLCPVCHRNKVEIANISNEKITAVLHLDHDHFSDYMGLLFKKYSIQSSIRPFVEKYCSYKPIIICQCCNWIDSVVKCAYPEIPKNFSFHPSLKAKLIIEARKKSHKIDKKLAMDLWLKESKSFSLKMINFDRDIQDLQIERGAKKIGYVEKAEFYRCEFKKYEKTNRGDLAGLSFTDFLEGSVSWST